MSNIEIKNLTKKFDTADGPLTVVDDITLSVAEGEFVCLLGPSGSGKSVTLNCIAGLLDATEGDIMVGGISVRQKQANYGYIFQQPRLLPWRTVEENLQFALRAETGRPVPNEKKRIADVLELMSLTGYEKFYIHQISGGMQNRVSIARSYIRNPDLLLMDEPFGALDEMTARKLRSELVSAWMRDKRTVVFVTHDIVEACYLADRILVYTPKPTRIASMINIDLPRPRVYGSEALHEVETRVLAACEQSLSQFTTGSAES
ncbi:ABC transporter ATP-binding protein [Pusillimonas sp.]|uniref:ABC transporter ATP-binding protein n=1 Tax=Pusillimonas sp. TaxID=3040095 RepID=UPI0029A8BA71|nr:ABC transporter ATP-binding protein [Pusillimonas sp.]MDX3896248.1 ABC transporter ATP-binding protein [Pusillimonas sp.]